ncbi:unnamed protein product, partial [Oppiella nova]
MLVPCYCNGNDVTGRVNNPRSSIFLDSDKTRFTDHSIAIDVTQAKKESFRKEYHEIIKDVHHKGNALGGIEFESIYVSDQINGERLQVYIPDLSTYHVVDAEECDDFAFDMEEFGNLVKRML